VRHQNAGQEEEEPATMAYKSEPRCVSRQRLKGCTQFFHSPPFRACLCVRVHACLCVCVSASVCVAVCLHTKFVRVILTLPLLCSIYIIFCIFFVGPGRGNHDFNTSVKKGVARRSSNFGPSGVNVCYTARVCACSR